jgi:4-hydroxy-tetrahydrodipicolinate synthase
LTHDGERPTTFPALEGVVSLMLTPFTESGGIDWRSYARYTEWQASRRPSALFAVCGSSEMKWLTRTERARLVAETIKFAGGLPVIATGNLDPDIEQHPDEARQMADLGAAAVVLVPPPQVSGDSERYRDYLVNLSGAVPCPVLVYEWPLVDNYLMDTQLFAELARRRVIAGIKDTTCTYEGIAAKQQVAEEAVVYQANTPYLLDALDIGVRGIMAITSAAQPELVISLWEAHQNGATNTRALHRELVYLDALLRLAYPATAKYLLNLQGVAMSTYTRWPVGLTPEIKKAFDVWHHQYLEIDQPSPEGTRHE